MTATTSRQRNLVLLVALLLVFALALAACGGRAGAHRAGGSGTPNMTSHQSGGSSASNTDLSSGEQQIDNLMSQLNSAASDANADYSSLDNPVQP